MKIKAVYPWGVLFGGNANNSANAGFSYANTNNTASNTNANVGSRLDKLITLKSEAKRS